ncbi:hypothetical protein Cs7R123_72220 [Catellatospora sp. TT07R-123]|nr:hypothetical protein Cs7R123_72220 [Catellatospora sp. TT07R-123]
MRLSIAGALLGTLPLLQGEWSAGVAAALTGVLVVGAWAWGSSCASRAGTAVGACLIGSMAAVFAVSQWPGGRLGAPWFDWFAGWLLVGGGGLVALLVDRIIHNAQVRAGSDIRPAARWRWVVAVAALVGVLSLVSCGTAAVVGDDDGSLRFEARDGELLPLPPTLRLVSADHCASGGSSGNCTAEFVVIAADGAARATTVTRLVDHLRGIGWSLDATSGSYRGCREVGGILPWTRHCLWLYTGQEYGDVPASPDTVAVHIDNIGDDPGM